MQGLILTSAEQWGLGFHTWFSVIVPLIRLIAASNLNNSNNIEHMSGVWSSGSKATYCKWIYCMHKDSGLRQNLFNMNIYSIAIHQVYTSMSI